MRVRSWMAALALIGASSILIGRGLSAQGPGEARETSPTKSRAQANVEAKPARQEPAAEAGREPARSGTKVPRIHLKLAIAGLGAQGCEVEIKPANPSCKFRPAPLVHVKSDGHATVELRDVELRGADRTCSMAITVREPGQKPQTIYRGFRTGSTAIGSLPPLFDCYINSRLADSGTGAVRK